MANVSKKIAPRILAGQQGEDAVAQFLVDDGYTILARNYRQRCGEIDLIASTKEVIVFVEVKFRTTSYFATSQVITPAKQNRIIQTARLFLCNYNEKNSTMIYRFDVALLTTKNNRPEITYLANAFVPADKYDAL